MVERVPDIILIFIIYFWWFISKSLQMMIEAMKLKMLTPWKESYDQLSIFKAEILLCQQSSV